MSRFTLTTFLLECPLHVRRVELLGSWDNFSKSYVMKNDCRRGGTQWTGCFSFTDIVCEGDSQHLITPRNGGLKMGGTYWYYYLLDGDVEYHDPAQPSTTACPLMPGQQMNILEVPHDIDFTTQSFSNTHTLNPEDKYVNPKPRIRLEKSPDLNRSGSRKRQERTLSRKLRDKALSPMSSPLMAQESSFTSGNTNSHHRALSENAVRLSPPLESDWFSPEEVTVHTARQAIGSRGAVREVAISKSHSSHGVPRSSPEMGKLRLLRSRMCDSLFEVATDIVDDGNLDEDRPPSPLSGPPLKTYIHRPPTRYAPDGLNPPFWNIETPDATTSYPEEPVLSPSFSLHTESSSGVNTPWRNAGEGMDSIGADFEELNLDDRQANRTPSLDLVLGDYFSDWADISVKDASQITITNGAAKQSIKPNLADDLSYLGDTVM